MALGAAAAVTQRLNLGTGACYPAVYDPILLAKQAATLDQVSRGRFLFGVTTVGMTCCSAITASTLPFAGRSCARRCSRSRNCGRSRRRSSTRTTEIVYRRGLRPVITTGAEIMDQLFAAT